MRKIKKIFEIQPTIGFTEFDIYKEYYQSFLASELQKKTAKIILDFGCLGRIY